MAIKTKKIGVIIRHAPYGNDFAQETIDAVLATAVFGQSLSVIFMADGVFQLLAGQQPAEGKKSIQKQLAAFELYDIDTVFVCQQALDERGITDSELSISVNALAQDALQTLLHEQDVLLSF